MLEVYGYISPEYAYGGDPGNRRYWQEIDGYVGGGDAPILAAAPDVPVVRVETMQTIATTPTGAPTAAARGTTNAVDVPQTLFVATQAEESGLAAFVKTNPLLVIGGAAVLAFLLRK